MNAVAIFERLNVHPVLWHLAWHGYSDMLSASEHFKQLHVADIKFVKKSIGMLLVVSRELLAAYLPLWNLQS
jgi:hypothetical protein